MGQTLRTKTVSKEIKVQKVNQKTKSNKNSWTDQASWNYQMMSPHFLFPRLTLVYKLMNTGGRMCEILTFSPNNRCFVNTRLWAGRSVRMVSVCTHRLCIWPLVFNSAGLLRSAHPAQIITVIRSLWLFINNGWTAQRALLNVLTCCQNSWSCCWWTQRGTKRLRPCSLERCQAVAVGLKFKDGMIYGHVQSVRRTNKVTWKCFLAGYVYSKHAWVLLDSLYSGVMICAGFMWI